jgi:hypothetical protein
MAFLLLSTICIGFISFLSELNLYMSLIFNHKIKCTQVSEIEEESEVCGRKSLVGVTHRMGGRYMS